MGLDYLANPIFLSNPEYDSPFPVPHIHPSSLILKETRLEWMREAEEKVWKEETEKLVRRKELERLQVAKEAEEKKKSWW